MQRSNVTKLPAITPHHIQSDSGISTHQNSTLVTSNHHYKNSNHCTTIANNLAVLDQIHQLPNVDSSTVKHLVDAYRGLVHITPKSTAYSSHPTRVTHNPQYRRIGGAVIESNHKYWQQGVGSILRQKCCWRSCICYTT